MSLSLQNKPLNQKLLKVFKGGSALLLSGLLVNLSAYAFHLFSGRLLPVPDYGKLQSMLSLFNILVIPASILSLLITKATAIYKKNDSPNEALSLHHVFVNKVFWGSCVASLIFIVSLPLLQKVLKIHEVNAFLVIWLAAIFCFFWSVSSGALKGWHIFFNSSLGGVVDSFFKFSLGILFIKAGFGFLGGLLGVLGGSFFHMLMNSYFFLTCPA